METMEKLKNGWRKVVEWFQQRKAGKVQKVLSDACKRKQTERIKKGRNWNGKARRGKRICTDPEMIPNPKMIPIFFALTLKWSPINLWNGKKQKSTARMRNIITALAMWSQSRLRVRKMILHYLKRITVKEKQRRKFVPSAEGSLSTYRLEFTPRTVA